MISKIEICNSKGKVFNTYTFMYDKTNKLIYLQTKSSNGEYISTLKKVGNKLVRVDKTPYDGLYPPTTYSYVFNEDGFIEKMTVNNNGIDGSVLRFVYWFQYDDKNRLIETTKREFHKGENPTDKFKELSDRYKEYIKYEDGNLQTTGLSDYNWRFNKQTDAEHKFKYFSYNKDIKNDTNIDLYWLCNGKIIERCTEWVGNHSKNVTDYSNEISFDYKVVDGNIIEIEATTCTYDKYKIYYVE